MTARQFIPILKALRESRRRLIKTLNKPVIPGHIDYKAVSRRLGIIREIKLRAAFASLLVIVFEFTGLIYPFSRAAAITAEGGAIFNNASTISEIVKNANLRNIDYSSDTQKSVLSLRTSGPANTSALPFKKDNFRMISKADFSANEQAVLAVSNPDEQTLTATVTDPVGKTSDVESISNTDDGVTLITLEHPHKFKPGVYTATVTTSTGQKIVQDFTWGVLALNTDKSVYKHGDDVFISIAVLNETGDMVCDASVDLVIKNASYNINETLSTSNGKIIVNKECSSHEFTLKPDYEAHYSAGGPGEYSLTLTATTKNGLYNINDSFEVRDDAPFDVTRTSATRIYPPLNYPVTLDIIANQDFEGTITETVPGDFFIENLTDESVIAPLNAAESIPIEQVLSSKTNNDPSGTTIADDEQTDTESASASASVEEDQKTEPEIDPNQETASTSAEDQNENESESQSAPDKLPEIDNSKILLGDLVPGLIPKLSLPFSGSFPVSLWFSQHLIDTYQRDLYRTFGLIGHDGVDFAMPVGTPILAVDDGEVVLADRGDYGITVVLQHSWGRSYYGHLSETIAQKGEIVKKGTRIALSGNTGITTGPHLHFGIKPTNFSAVNGYYGKIDPAFYLGLTSGIETIAQGPTEVAVLGASDTAVLPAKNPESKELRWSVKMSRGDRIKIGYSYLAPRVSPQFYTLGPAVFTDSNGREVFRETRTWSIAADAMDLKFKKGSFAKSTCTSGTSEGGCNQAVTGVGFQPKALIVFLTQQTATGFAVNNNMTVGIATESAQFSVSQWSVDAAATMNTGYGRSSDEVVNVRDSGGPDIAGEIQSFDTDGFTIKWTTNVASAYIIHYIAVGGSDITDTAAGTFNTRTSAGSQTVVGPDFQPDFLFVLAGRESFSNTDARLSIGMADGTNQYALTVESEAAVGNATSFRHQSSGDIISIITDSGGTQRILADLTAFTSTGFTINVSTNSTATAMPIYYLALKGGRHAVGAFNQPASGTSSPTPGFQPRGVMLASFNTTTNASITTTSSLSIGGASANPSSLGSLDTEGGIWGDDRNGEADANTNMSTYDTKSIRLATSPAGGGAATTNAEADLQSFDTTGFTLNWTTADATAREIVYWAAGSVGATQEDYRWYRNRDNITPTTAMQDENTPAIMTQNQPQVRLRMNMGMTGESLYASSQKFKLQYATATAPTSWVDVADPWCNDTTGSPLTCTNSWSTRKKITFDNTASNENLTNFPVMIKLTSSNISFASTQNSGQDIRFIDPSDPNTILEHDIEKWDEAGNEAIVWVKVPQIDADSDADYIWMYYGNGSIADGQQATSVWTNGYSGIYQFNETSGTTTPDSTVNARDGTYFSTPARVTGKIGQGISVDGANEAGAVEIADNNAFDNSNKLTVKFWFKADSFANWDRLVHKEFYSGGALGSWYIQQDGDATGKGINVGIHNNTSFRTTSSRPEFNMTTLTWYHIAVTWDGAKMRIYINGIETHSSAGFDNVGTMPNSTYCVTIGMGGGCSAQQNSSDGDFDQVYISNSVARSQDWIVAEYNSENNTFVTFGTAEAQNAYDWTFYDNTSVANEAPITNEVLTGSTASGNHQTYHESNPTDFNPTEITAGARREWDFSLDGTNATNRETYYFRLVTDEGFTMNYTNYPTLTVNPPLSMLMRHGKWFGYQQEEAFTF